jgi:hypothetical protein
MDTFNTLLDLEPSPFVAPQPNCGELAQQHIESSDSPPVDQDRHDNNLAVNFCVIL